MSDVTRTKARRRRPGASIRYKPGAVILPDVRGRAGTLVASDGMPPWVVHDFKAIVRAMMANRAELNALADARTVEMPPEGTRVRIRSQMGNGLGLEFLDGERKGLRAWTLRWFVQLDGEGVR